MRWDGPDGYWASDDRSLIDGPKVHAWMSNESYWAAGRSEGVVARAVSNSLVVGLYSAAGEQAGFARVVTDYATFAWLCDVFVDAHHRGHGLGSFLAEMAVGHPAVREVRQVLMAEPGRSIYRRQGFGPLLKPERWMERPAPALGRPAGRGRKP
ncbi:MAG: GNAT family N-acetyltransferase [Streptosporangiaceae bacterium]|jgi:GNAT superfamily N-acetyltransferase